jgi:hypothetical protein
LTTMRILHNAFLMELSDAAHLIHSSAVQLIDAGANKARDD